MLGLGHSQPPVPSELQPARELLNQSEQINLADAIEATLRSNPQLLAAVETIRARRSLLASEQRRWSPTASFFTYSDATPLLGQYFETDIISYPQNSDESSTYEGINFDACHEGDGESSSLGDEESSSGGDITTYDSHEVC